MKSNNSSNEDDKLNRNQLNYEVSEYTNASSNTSNQIINSLNACNNCEKLCANCQSRLASNAYSNAAINLSDETNLNQNQTYCSKLTINNSIAPRRNFSSYKLPVNDDLEEDCEFTWTDFDIRKHRFNCSKLMLRLGRSCRKSIKHFSFKDQFFSIFPLLDKFRTYNLKSDLILDIIAGITISILHIPQGIAYSLLIGIPPQYGLYTSFFPVIIYSWMGTSQHISVGTMSVLDMMLSQIVKKYHLQNLISYVNLNTSTLISNSSIHVPTNDLYAYELGCSAVQLLTVLCFLVGAFQIVMGIFQMGAISIILSDQLVSGFSCGAAFHVVISQIPYILEIKVDKVRNKSFSLFYSAVNITNHLEEVKLYSVMLSFFVFFIIMFYREFLEKYMKKISKIPFPIDLVVIVISTALSYFFKLTENYKVAIMGKIATGIPEPVLPPLTIVNKEVLMDAFVLAMISYASALSLSKIYAKKHQYTIGANQEFFALGISNLCSSFFKCFPATASLSRASVMGNMAKTQFSSLVSSCIILLMMLFLSPVLTCLPKCVVAVIIVCAQKSLLMQVKEFPVFWKLSKYEGLIWIVTFVSVICFGIDIGIMSGALFSVLTIVLRFYHPKLRLLGQLPFTDIYLDIRQHKGVKEIPGVKVIQFTSPLFFMNKDMFQEKLLKRVLKNQVFKGASEGFDYGPVNVLILDCSAMSFIDTGGVEAIAEISNELQKKNVQVCLAALSPPVISMFTRMNFFEKSPYTLIFPSVHEAVIKSDTPLLSRKLPFKERSSIKN